MTPRVDLRVSVVIRPLPFIGKCVPHSRRFQLIKAPRPLLLCLGPLRPLLVLQALRAEVETITAVVAPPVVSKPVLCTSAIVIYESVSSFYSCGFVQDLIRDAPDGCRLPVHLPVLSNIQSAILIVDLPTEP